MRIKSWTAISNALAKKKENRSSIFDIMSIAHADTVGAVRSLRPPHPALVKLYPEFKKTKGLKFSIDGDTLLFWNADVYCTISQDIRRVSWSCIEKRLSQGKKLSSIKDFYHLLGGF
jgi:hypothetical protein